MIFLVGTEAVQLVPRLTAYHCSRVPAKVMVANLLQLLKAWSPMEVTDAGMVRLVILLP